MVDKIRSSFGRVSLLPARGQLTSSGGGSAGRHHARSVGSTCTCVGWRRLSFGEGGRVGPSPVLGQHTVLVADTLLLGRCGDGIAVVALVEASARPDPGRLSRVMINVVGAAQVVLATLPAVGEPSLRVFKRTVPWVLGLPCSGCAVGRNGRGCGGRACGAYLAESLRGRLGGRGRSLAGVHVGVEVRRRLVRGRGSCCGGAVHGRVGGGRGAGCSSTSLVVDGCLEVGGQVQDELAVHDHVVV